MQSPLAAAILPTQISVERFKQQAPLNEQRADFFYGGGAEGYTDYPTL